MTSSMKKRITQIRHGQVPKGSKMTQLGIVPSDWDIVPIGDIGRIVTGSTPLTVIHDYYVGDRLFITPADFTEGIYVDNTSRTVSDSAYGVSRVIPPDSIYVVCIGATVGKTNMCRVSAICNQQINAIVPGNGFCNHFLYYGIDYFFNRTKARYVGSQTLPIVSKNLFSRVGLALPPLAEQRKIAKILATQDRVIELLNMKIEQLKLLKKYCLRKMFPQHGKTMPEVRFQGFTGAWERKRLDEVFFEHTEKGNPELPALTIVQGGGTIKREESERKLQYDKNSLSSYKVVGKGDFIVHLRSFEGGLELATIHGLISPAYDVFRGKAIDIRFYYAYFRSAEFIRGDLTPHVYGIRDGRSIDIDGLKSIRIPYAPLIEQHAIGNFIATLDNQIALHQQKHDEEKRKKKALMQLLLTGIVRV